VLQWVQRVFALACLAAALVYPAPSFLAHSGLPWWIRVAWVVLALAAAVRPGWSLLLFVALAPLTPIVPRLAEWPDVSLGAQWLLALLVPAWAISAWRPGPPALPRPATLLLALISSSLVVTLAPLSAGESGLAGAASSLHRFLREDLTAVGSPRHVFAPVFAWVVMAGGIGFAWLLWRYLRDHRESGHLRLGYAATVGAALVAAFGVRQWWTREDLLSDFLEFDPFITRINSTFTDVNTLGSYLAGVLPVTVTLLVLARDRRQKAVLGAAALLTGTATLCTGSRAAWVATVAGVAACAWLAAGADAGESLSARRAIVRRVLRRLALTGAVLVVALTGYATLTNARHAAQRSYFDAVLHTLNLRVPADERLKGRVTFWEAGLNMVETRPWTGIGIGRFYRDVSLYSSRPDRLPRRQENAHNYPLQLAAESGLPALAVWVAMVVAVLWSGARQVRHGADARSRHLAAAGVGGSIAFLITCLTGHPLLLREGQVGFWTLLAIAHGPPTPAAGEARSRRWFSVAVVTIVAVTLWLALAERGSVDLSRQTPGVYAREIDGEGRAFRWTDGTATLFVREGTRTVEFQVRSLAPFPQTLEITLDGERLDRTTLEDHEWRAVRYVLPKKAGEGRFYRLRLVTTPPWNPPGDGRELGVMIRDVEERR
jgi:hypothetical protein